MDMQQAAQKAIGLMDLITLGDDDTEQKVVALCQQASTPFGDTAKVCVYPCFVTIARKTLRDLPNSGLQVATVTNFPHGGDDLGTAVAETRAAVELCIEAGADFLKTSTEKVAINASRYLELDADILGADRITARYFRFGASNLLGNLLEVLEKELETDQP